MAFRIVPRDFSQLIETLHLLKFFHEIGIYENIVRNAREIDGEDWYEFVQLGLESVAPVYYQQNIYLTESGEWITEDELEGDPEDAVYDYPNTMHHFSSPEMLEYYRLCRLYEYRHGIAPEENPFVTKVDSYFCVCINNVPGYFGASFDDDRYTQELQIEFSPEGDYAEPDLIIAIHNMLDYYRVHIKDLRLEVMKWPPIFLPALPAAKGCDNDGQD